MRIDELKVLLETVNRVVITTHKSPDGDAIGSSLALFHFLKKLEKEVTVIVPDEFPTFLNWMDGSEYIIYHDTQTKKAERLISESDLIFSLDYNALSRVGNMGIPLGQSQAKKIVIDHHQEPQEFADYYFVDTECCSTSQLIYEFIEKLDKLDKIDVTIGKCIYCGIMTDTGSFRFPSTTFKTHEIIAHLLRIGVKGFEVHENVYDNNSVNRIRLLGYALSEKMKLFLDYNAAYIVLTQEELKRNNFKKGDSEGLVNYPLSISGINMSILITEKDNEVALSLRSKGNFYVNKLAKEHFDGGGHIYAAGGRLLKPVDEVVRLVEQVIRSIQKEL